MKRYTDFKLDAQKFNSILEKNGLKKKWIAQKLDVHESTVSRWCTGATQPPYEAVLLIAELLELEIEDLGAQAA